jgi:pimeloyl-ACP methyl ester carboxylesterase
MNALRLALACALLVAALALPAAAAGDASPYRLWADADTVRAGENQQWPVTMTVRNDGDYGLFLDSLMLSTTPLAGPRAGQTVRSRLRFSFTSSNVGNGEEHSLQLGLQAARVDTRLVFELCGHTREVTGIVLADTVVAGGFDPFRFHPPTQVRVAGRTHEFTRVAPNADGEAAGAGVLMLSEEGSDPGANLELGVRLAALGYAVVVASPPGTGRSQGPADLAGPASMAGALAALDSLAHTSGVDPARLAVWGTGSGGTLALLLAERRADLKAVVAQSATVDPWATYRMLSAAARPAFVAEAGRDSAAWRARSPLAGLAKLKAPTLVLHGAKDDLAPAAAARGMLLALAAQSTLVDSLFDANSGHALPANLAFRPGQRFLKSHTAAGK